MNCDSENHHRRSIRLKGYDYSQDGAYFVTICTCDRACLFGKISNEKMTLNECGEVVDRYWNEIPQHFLEADLDEYIIMPNHIHGIITIKQFVGAKDFSPDTNHSAQSIYFPDTKGAKDFSPLHATAHGTSKTIGSIIRGFKIGVTKWVRNAMDIRDAWQRNYYEHVIRDDDDLTRVREYIIENPANWAIDKNNPKRI
ncbi:MAG TPA: hypothetical protein DD381_07360 [Lentisphaeria bacterium]|nr:MAG: hypothetical protein A2X47_03935 [Lentisphaerae bacterium GWF2_38_69]HBM16139.1 hypothetical protein [Lentisphaeria bacterium]